MSTPEEKMARHPKGGPAWLGQDRVERYGKPLPLDKKQSASTPREGYRTTIDDFATDRDNNFNLLRFIAASAVLLSHCWPLALGSNQGEPLARIFPGLTLGSSAVIVFFAISGFLVASSWDRNRSPSAFLIARLLRIFPGLLVMLVISVLVFGPLLTKYSIAEYLSMPRTWTYLPSNLLLARAQLTLPGVLDGATYSVLNGSLWTLGYEFACYLALLLAGIWGGLKRTSFALTLLLFVVIGLLLSQLPGAGTRGFANKVLLLGPAFLVGTAAWVWRASIRLKGLPALLLAVAAAAAMLVGLPFAHLLFAVATTYGSLYVAFVPGGAIRKFNEGGDWSYGMYIYAFPIQQIVHYYFPQLAVSGMFVVAFFLTLALAALSWIFIEKRAIEWGKAYLKRRRGAPKKVSAPLTPLP